MEYTACAITGHRPWRFKWKYNENNSGCKRLKRGLKEQLVQLYDRGVRHFYIGGALGTDLWSGEILMELKEQPEYSGIELILVLPLWGTIITGIRPAATGCLSCGSTVRRLSSLELRKILL